MIKLKISKSVLLKTIIDLVHDFNTNTSKYVAKQFRRLSWGMSN